MPGLLLGDQSISGVPLKLQNKFLSSGNTGSFLDQGYPFLQHP